MRLAPIVGALILTAGIYHYWNFREIVRVPGILISEVPEQGSVPEKTKPILIANAVLDPLATYKIKARVLSTERYWTDHGAELVPIDVALGWGPASDSELLDKLTIRQAGRFYYFSWRGDAPADPHVIGLNSANIHVIPANKFILDEVKKLRKGDIITMNGYLVRANFRDGSDWKSSLTREDSGNGACELMLVQSIFKQP
jgi:hypothetical protein